MAPEKVTALPDKVNAPAPEANVIAAPPVPEPATNWVTILLVVERVVLPAKTSAAPTADGAALPLQFPGVLQFPSPSALVPDQVTVDAFVDPVMNASARPTNKTHGKRKTLFIAATNRGYGT